MGKSKVLASYYITAPFYRKLITVPPLSHIFVLKLCIKAVV